MGFFSMTHGGCGIVISIKQKVCIRFFFYEEERLRAGLLFY